MNRNWQDSRNTTVLLWGATGFIGRNLTAYLESRVRRVIAVGRAETEVVFDKDAPVVAINLAAERYDASRFQHYQSHIFAQNVGIATRFYDFCLRHGISEARIASSIAVYSGSETILDDSRPLNDELPAASEAMYGMSKRIGEEIAALYHKHYGINSILFRLSNPYGAHDSQNIDRAHVLAAFVLRALTTTGAFTVRGGAEATRDFIYVGDVCEIFYRSLATEGIHDAYNLATGSNTRIVELAELVLKHTDPTRPIVFEGAPTSSVVHRICKVDRLKAAFELQDFTPLEKGLVETIVWYRAQR